MKMHRRIINLTYFEHKLPKFESREDQDEYYRALGRMVMYGLLNDQPDDMTQLVGLTVEDEIVGAYHRPLPAFDEQRLDYKVHATLDQMFNKPFVIGAVKDRDGKFGFNS